MDETQKDMTSSMASSLEKDDLEQQSLRDLENPAPENAKDEAVERDPNIVDWDGPDDPMNPMNWPTWRKLSAALVLSFITFLTPLASAMIAPAVYAIMEEFQTTNTYVGAFIVSGYLIGYCAGPLLIAPLSELYGRAIVYNVCMLIFLIFNIACAVSTNAASLIVFRIFTGIGGSCPITIGAGTLADIVPPERRGLAMALWVMGPIIGPTFGPLAAGYLTEAAGWRWSFWLLAIAAGVAAIICAFTLQETYAYVLLDRKAKKLRKETGNPNLRSVMATDRSPKDFMLFSIVRPLKMLFLSPIVFLVSIYSGILYGYLYILITTFPSVFEGVYGFSTGTAGLSYLPQGVGSFLGLVLLAFTSDRMFKTMTVRNGGVSKPEFRLPPMMLGAVAIPIGLFWYGWTISPQIHWIVPMIATAVLGFGIMLVFMAVSTYLVDCYTLYAASATAGLTVMRSLIGAFLPLAGTSLYGNLGYGWGNSVLGFIAAAMIPVPFGFYIYGQRLRNSRLFRVEF